MGYTFNILHALSLWYTMCIWHESYAIVVPNASSFFLAERCCILAVDAVTNDFCRDCSALYGLCDTLQRL